MSEATAEHHDDIIYPAAIPFLLVHLSAFAAIWSGVTPKAVWLGITLYFVRMFGITAGFHRYFSHRSFKTSRAFQFFLAFLAETSAQRGVLWWASKHRDHHKHSDTPEDVHSPRQFGLFFSHIGWVYAKKRGSSDLSNVKDWMKFPELVWLDKQIYLPALLLAAFCLWFAGWSGLVVGFLWSTILLYHGTFAINSFAHLWGKQRYYTGDDSRNNFFLAIITLGEGWHNNHHYFMGSARQGFFAWEWDPTYYILKGLEKIGVVWDVCEPSEAVLKGERRLSRKQVEQAAVTVIRRCQEIGTLQAEKLHEAIQTQAEKLVGRSASLAEVVERAITLATNSAQSLPA